jgi:hypothetical protein
MHMGSFKACMWKKLIPDNKILKFMYVSGTIVSTTDTGVINTPLNGSVAFLKSNYIYVTSEYWKILVNFELSTHEEVITTLRASMSGLEEISNGTSYEDMMAILHTEMSEGEKITQSLVLLENYDIWKWY